MLFNVFAVFFVHPSGSLDLMMYVWVTFGFLSFFFFFFFASLGTGDVILLHFLTLLRRIDIIDAVRKCLSCAESTSMTSSGKN